MQLEIRDINDNPPLFVNSPYNASVDEVSPVLSHLTWISLKLYSWLNRCIILFALQSASVGTTVYSGISATDLDAGTNKEIEYAIVPGDGSIVSFKISIRFLLKY